MQQDNSSEGSIKCEQSDNNYVKAVSHITASSSMKSLMYKSLKIQQKNYCSNICQIITPLLCIMFTLVIKIITGDVVSSQVYNQQFPKPINMPLIYQLLPLNLSCKQIYFFQFQNSTIQQRQEAEQLLQSNLKRYCQQTKHLSPVFDFTQDVNKKMVQLLDEADKEQFERGNDLKTQLADGIIKFSKLSQKQFHVSLAINDYRLAQYHRNNGVTKIKITTNGSIFTGYIMTTQGYMQLIQKVTRPYLFSKNNKQIIMGSYIYMPFQGQDTTLVDKTVNIVGSGLYPLGLSLLLPLFLYIIVSQKQQRLLQIMKMNGLNIKYYWINTFIFNFIISNLTFLVFYLFGTYVIQLSFFAETGVTLFWIILIGWSIAQISLTTLVQIFINNAKSATIIGYLLSIFSTLVGEALSVTIYPFPMQMPILMVLYPPFCLCRIITFIGLACSTGGCYQSFSTIQHQMKKCIIILYGWFIIFLLSIWLNDKIQQQYGVSRTPKCIQSLRKCLKRGNQNGQIVSQSEIQLQQSIKNHYDASINLLNKQVSSLPINSKPMVIKGISKKYKTMSGRQNYTALKPFNLAIEQRQIFGLLGPNGAGKTTLISVLTGMYQKSQGNAWINGLPVGQSQTNQYIGVCPQFDLLWPSLTVYEHLKFYALLKGVQSQQLQSKIQESLRDVDLFESKNVQSKQLSGGMQRRLSIAISLVANPSIVFLDQPSSGLDPSHRRKMWDILLKCKKKTSIFLTTHLMEEAQALCDRVGIISKGQLKCIGSTSQLKQLHGQGYRLHLSFKKIFNQNNQNITEQIIKKFDAKIINELDSRVSMKVQKQKIMECIGWLKNEKGISWLVSQPSLYDVFINFIN